MKDIASNSKNNQTVNKNKHVTYTEMDKPQKFNTIKLNDGAAKEKFVKLMRNDFVDRAQLLQKQAGLCRDEKN